MMLLVEFYFVGLILPFANSNYEYDYDPNSNYDSNAMIEDCNGPENDQLSKTNCFCYDAPETDIPYSICKESVLLSGMVLWIFQFYKSHLNKDTSVLLSLHIPIPGFYWYRIFVFGQPAQF